MIIRYHNNFDWTKLFAFLILLLFIVAGSITIKKLVIQNQSNNQAAIPEKITLKVRGSIPYWDQDKAYSSFQQNVGVFDYVALFWYYLKDDGSVEKYQYTKEDKSIIDFAHAQNIKVTAVIANLPDEDGSDWDSKLVENVIGNQNARSQHIKNIVAKLDELGFDGVSIDYEQVDTSQKDNFSLFIKELSDACHKKGKFVGVALHPKNKDMNQDDNLGEFQDWEVLAGPVDQLYIMAYGEHYDESEAGSIASATWVKKILEYASSLNLDKNKVFLGIPLYAYRWQKDSEKPATGLTYSQVEKIVTESKLKVNWDTSSQSPYLKYEKNGKSYQIWFENAQSVAEKIKLATKFKIGGVFFWHLGGEDPQVWEKVREIGK